MGDGTWKVFLNANGTPDETVSEELREFLRYLAGKLHKGEAKQTAFVKNLDSIIEKERHNDEWRRMYMTAEMDLYMRSDDLIEQGRQEGIAEGISGAVDIYRDEMNLSDEDIISRIVARFHLTDEQARAYVR
ncbi:MAG: hypothetical protein IJT32_05635 [Lachnospiraceae bacterium]|nr:hypothetical protein [Lachnospiraceae bacterium]